MSFINTLRRLIGSKSDFVHVPYVNGENTVLAYLKTGYYHIHGKSFSYPILANNVVLTSGEGAWNNTGNITQVIPVNALNESYFDLHWLNISAISGNCEALIEIFSGLAENEVKIGSTRTHRNAVQSQEGSNMIMIPQQSANTRISCRVSDSTQGTITCAVSFEGHYYKI
jgi:hypothetical protein